ncbi:MAG: DUF2116 family Zn-ribbon domain-containing protein [Flavobacteriales bacterium]|nr:DUF2116 family Zn-ribbon domain-containing protein [Flavobacteriales bacterium]
METKEHICLTCGEPLFGRADKKFCNDNCRSAYNNQKNKMSDDYFRKVNTILRKNRRILEELNPAEKAKTTKEKLLLNGFNFYYYTNVYRTKQGKTYYFVYEHGYLELENEEYALVRKLDYISPE